MRQAQPTDETIGRILKMQRIAVVGLSDDPSKASHRVASYMKRAGKTIIPINPNCDTVLGEKSYSTLVDAPGPIELVNVFRLPKSCPDVTEQAVRVGASAVWLQSGITSAEARRIAEQAGIDYIEDRCLMVEHHSRS